MYNLSTSELSTLAIIFGILIITYFVLRSIFFPLLKKIAKRTSTFIDDLFLDKKFLNRLSYVLVIIVFTFLTSSPQFNLEIFSNPIISRLVDSLLTLFVGLTAITELKNKIVDLKKELMDSRFALATSQLEDTSVFKKIRKEIAQANTVLTEKLSVENVEEGE